MTLGRPQSARTEGRLCGVKAVPHSSATLLATIWFVGGLLAGAAVGRLVISEVSRPYEGLAPLIHVVGTVESEYLEPIPRETLVDAAIHGVLDRLDAQSSWLEPHQLQALRDDTEGATPSLGIEIEAHADGVSVTRVIDGSPARLQGLATGDRILEIDGQALAGMALPDVMRHLEQGIGTSATLTLYRDGWAHPRTIEAARDRLPRRVVSGGVLEDSVIYVRLVQFQAGAAEELHEKVKALGQLIGGLSNATGLILDLRDNPGGLLTEAVEVADLFLDEGVIVKTQGRQGSWPQEAHHATVGGLPTDLPVVVMTNRMSASASEIVAGAFQDTGRGALVGETTYGKGTVQKIFVADRRPDFALKLTVGRYTTPSGQPVAPKEGRTPDYIVTFPRAAGPMDRLAEELAALELDPEKSQTLTALLATLPSAPPNRTEIPWDAPLEERFTTDPQLSAAWNLLTR